MNPGSRVAILKNRFVCGPTIRQFQEHILITSTINQQTAYAATTPCLQKRTKS